ncbi:MAG TPA: divalent-cation tolerance protein CutA [Steroidobacteraceae bacterium]|nr:divalent-cation tolerance protein CutA [Steroidobacteraceae bacterium]
MSLPAFADHPAILVLCTCPEESVALDIARVLVKEGLAGCVNRLPQVGSVYRWQGQLCEELEQLLVIKTTPSRYQALEMRLKTLHPYEMPEIIAIPVVAGSRPYLAWLAAPEDVADPNLPSVHRP